MAIIGFFVFDWSDCAYSHACLVYRRKDKPSWVIFDPIYSMMKKTECKMEKPINDLLVLEEIKKDKSQKITEMRCAKIEKGQSISNKTVSNPSNYIHKVFFNFNW